MKQEKLQLADRPIKGDPDKVAAELPPVEPVDHQEISPPATLSDDRDGQNTKEESVEAQESLPVALNIDQEVSGYSKAMAAFEGDRKRIEKLLAKDSITLMDVETAKEVEGPAIVFLNALEDPKTSKLRRWATSLHELHRQVTGRMSDLAAQPKALRKACADLYSRRDRQERDRIQKERIERERKIREEQERQRLAEVEAAKSAGASEEEIKSIEEAPMPVVAAPAPREETKIEGVSMVYALKFKSMRDVKLFVEKVLTPNPERLMELFKVSDAAFKSFGTSHFNKETGVISLPDIGVEWEVLQSPRRTGNA